MSRIVSSSGPIGTGIPRNIVSPGSQRKGTVVIQASNSAANVGVTVTSILAGNNRRAYLFLQNRGIQNVFITFGNQPTNSGGNFPGAILIPPNGFYEPLYVPVDTIYAVAAAGTNLVAIVQGVFNKVYL